MSDVPQIGASTLIAAFIKLRDKRDELRHAYEKAEDELKRKQQLVKVAIMKHMEAVDSTQLKGAEGVAYREVKQKFSCGDWTNLWAYIAENNRFDMLQKRVGEKAMADFLEETGTLPPGVNMIQEYDVVIRRS